MKRNTLREPFRSPIIIRGKLELENDKRASQVLIMPASTTLEIYLLGPFRVVVDGRVVEEHRWLKKLSLTEREKKDLGEYLKS